MPIQSPLNVNLETHFDWPRPNALQLTTFVKTALLSEEGTNVNFRGTVEKHDPLNVTTEYEYESLESWANAIEKGVTSTYIRITNHYRNHTLTISADFAQRKISCWVSCSEEEISNVQELFKELEKSLELAKRSNSRASSSSFMERNYYAPKPVKPQPFLDSLTQFLSKSHISGQVGEIRFATPVGSGQKFQEHNAWCQAVVTQWETIATINYWAKSELINMDFQWDYLSDDLRIRVEAPTQTALNNVLTEIEKHLSIIPQRDKFRMALEGGERVYFTKKNVDPHWFETAVETISTYLRADFYCDLRLRIATAPQQTFVWQYIPKWKQSVLDKWPEMLEASGYFSGPSLTINFRYDNRRERIVLEVRARTKEEAEGIFDHLTQTLDLQQTEGDVYAHPRSSGYFSVQPFKYSDFADALESSIRHFIKDKYQVLEATVIEPTDEERQSLQTFDDFAKFINRLRVDKPNDKPYDEVHLKIHGPHGTALGIHLLEKKTRLEIKSSLSPNEFPNLVQEFKNNLSLKKIAATREAAQTQKTALRDTFWVLIVLPLLITLITNALLTDQVKNAPFAKITLEIIAPLVNKEKPTVVPKRKVHLVWRLTHEKWFKKQIIKDKEAEVRILNATGNTVNENLKAQPGVSFQLEPGLYQAVVTMNDYGLYEKVIFNIPDTAK